MAQDDDERVANKASRLDDGLVRIVGARRQVVDFTLPFGRVLHDYLAPVAVGA